MKAGAGQLLWVPENVTYTKKKKAQGMNCAGDLHPSFSGLACISWFNRRTSLGFSVKAKDSSQMVQKSSAKGL